MTARRPRTPAHWPRMKVRGAYRRWLTAQRNVSVLRVRARMRRNGDGKYTFVAVPPLVTGPEIFIVESKTVTDGWGRNVTDRRNR
jgi:hypothetical protein